MAPSLVAYGASLDREGTYLVKGAAVQLRPSLGYLARSMEGGHLGGAFDGDAVALRFELPYVYRDGAGKVVRTLSREEWLASDGAAMTAEDAAARGADASAAPAGGARAALFAEDVPEGWSVWIERDGKYRQCSKDDLAAGVSGEVVLRYEGDKEHPRMLGAQATMPEPAVGFVGEGFSDEVVDVSFSVKACSYTDSDGNAEWGTVSYEDAHALTLRNDKSKAQVAVAWEVSLAVRAAGSETCAFAAGIARVSVPEASPAAEGFELSLSCDAGLAADGAVVLDVTGLAEDERTALGPTDPATWEAFGLSPIDVSAADDGVRVALPEGEARPAPGEERLFYVAASVDCDALVPVPEDAEAYEPVAASVQVTARFGAGEDEMRFSDRAQEALAFSAADFASAPAEGDAAGFDDASGSDDTADDAEEAPEDAKQPAPDAFGIGEAGPVAKTNALDFFGMAAPLVGTLDPNLLRPKVDVAGTAISTGSNQFLVRNSDEVSFVVSASPSFSTGYLGGGSTPAGQAARGSDILLNIPFLYLGVLPYRPR